MTLHPQAKAFVEMAAASGRPGWEEMEIVEARATFKTFDPFFGERPEINRIENRSTDNGIRLRVYCDVEEAAPAIMYFHGGGWVLGDLETHDTLCRRIAQYSRCTVISVDYGLSPENRFPGPLEDCYHATEHVAGNAESFGIDPHRMAVVGDSAGGHLATSVAIRSRDRKGPKIALQVLLYPAVDMDFETDSYQQFASGFGLTRENMRWFWRQLLGEDRHDDSAIPLSAALEGLPPALIVTAEYDVLRDEGERYAERLKDVGNDVTLRRYEGMLHAFMHFSGWFDTGRKAVQEIGNEIRRRMNREASD